MLKFTSEQDLSRLQKDNPAYPIIAELIKNLITDTLNTDYPYSEDGDGFIALIDDPADTERALTEVWSDGDWGLLDIPWEGVTLQGNFYHAIFLANNQYGIIFIIPRDLVKGDLLAMFEKILDPPFEETQPLTGEKL